MVGARLLFPGPALDGASLYDLMRDEGATAAIGVPTVWLQLQQYVQAQSLQPIKELRLKRVLIGGTAVPRAVVETFEKDFGARQASAISSILKIVAYVVGGIMAIGAVFGALNTMYSAVSTRSREIATLRAIGFGPVPVVVSVFVEALLLAFIGGAVGALIAWLMFNGHSVDTLGGGFGGQLIFDLAVTPGLVALGIIWACVIGVIGGLFPAIRAARLPVATALRAI